MDFKISAQKLGLEVDEYIEIIELFLETGINDLNRLEHAVANNDTQKAAEHSHSLKGASGNLGLTDIYEKARDIEDRSRENNLDGVADEIQEINQDFKNILAALKK